MTFIERTSHNPEYVQTHCNDRRNLFHFECRKRYFPNISQC